jgi:lipopolysaccharide biosynthesis glycosyltransferase
LCMQEKKIRNKLYKPICIVSIANNTYAQHLAVTFASLLKNTKGDVPEFFVISDELTTGNKNRLLETVNPFGATIEFLQMDRKFYEDESICHWMIHPVYIKIFIPELLPQEIEKVIYLDCDVIVEEDIYDLWNIDISGYHLAAVPDTTQLDRLSVLIGEAGKQYFNAGVMLLNLRKWREDNTLYSLQKFISENNEKLLYFEQDALNAIMYKKWLNIDVKWNMQPTFFRKDGKESSNNSSLRHAIEKPYIIHYTGIRKPWHYITSHPLRNNYYKYLEFTPWRGFSPRFTFRDALECARFMFKKVAPSLFMVVKRMVIKRAINGSTTCARICNFFHIELQVE